MHSAKCSKDKSKGWLGLISNILSLASEEVLSTGRNIRPSQHFDLYIAGQLFSR